MSTVEFRKLREQAIYSFTVIFTPFNKYLAYFLCIIVSSFENLCVNNDDSNKKFACIYVFRLISLIYLSEEEEHGWFSNYYK